MCFYCTIIYSMSVPFGDRERCSNATSRTKFFDIWKHCSVLPDSVPPPRPPLRPYSSNLRCITSKNVQVAPVSSFLSRWNVEQATFSAALAGSPRKVLRRDHGGGVFSLEPLVSPRVRAEPPPSPASLLDHLALVSASFGFPAAQVVDPRRRKDKDVAAFDRRDTLDSSVAALGGMGLEDVPRR